MERNKVYSEVRIDYFDQDANFWCVDAWKSDNDDEEGKCVGIIHPSGDYYIFDYKAMFCENVIDAVNEKVREIKSNAVKTSDKIIDAIITSIEEDSSVYEQSVSPQEMLAWLKEQKALLREVKSNK